jgi:hypothetical protein
MVSLGVDLSRITTLRNLQDGLKACMRGLMEDAHGEPAESAPRPPVQPSAAGQASAAGARSHDSE